MQHILLWTAATLTLLLLVNTVTATSDPSAMLCEEACWEQEVLAETCETARHCDSDQMTNRAYLRCARPCWHESSACQRICRRRFFQVLGTCRPNCRGVQDEDCMLTCFMDRILTYLAERRRNNNGRLSTVTAN